MPPLDPDLDALAVLMRPGPPVFVGERRVTFTHDGRATRAARPLGAHDPGSSAA